MYTCTVHTRTCIHIHMQPTVVNTSPSLLACLQNKFEGFKQFSQDFSSDSFRYEQLEECDFVFMRWKVMVCVLVCMCACVYVRMRIDACTVRISVWMCTFMCSSYFCILCAGMTQCRPLALFVMDTWHTLTLAPLCPTCRSGFLFQTTLWLTSMEPPSQGSTTLPSRSPKGPSTATTTTDLQNGASF